jgi:hypothetical protein
VCTKLDIYVFISNTYDLQTWLWYHYNISQRHTTTNTDKIIYQFICYSIFGFIYMFCRPLFVLLFIFFWPLGCLFLFDIRILITPLVSSSSSYNHNRVVGVMIVWWLDLQLSIQSVPITTHVVSSNPALARCTRYNIM